MKMPLLAPFLQGQVFGASTEGPVSLSRHFIIVQWTL